MAPMQQGQGPGLTLRDLGEEVGEDRVTLLTSEMPAHTHALNAEASAGDANSPAGNLPAEARQGRQTLPQYSSSAGSGPLMNADAVGIAGSGAAHNNMPPYLTLNYIIALQGVFPARS
jgi:microcystin-dependent protein